MSRPDTTVPAQGGDTGRHPGRCSDGGVGDYSRLVAAGGRARFHHPRMGFCGDSRLGPGHRRRRLDHGSQEGGGISLPGVVVAAAEGFALAWGWAYLSTLYGGVWYRIATGTSRR